MPVEVLEKLNITAQRRGKPFKLLIIDDELPVQQAFKEMCEISQALKIEVASDGTQALEKINTDHFDLITVDIIMPEVSGLDLIPKMKEKLPGVPVFIITGNATEKLVNEAGFMGANKVIYKPVDLIGLLTEISSVLCD